MMTTRKGLADDKLLGHGLIFAPRRGWAFYVLRTTRCSAISAIIFFVSNHVAVMKPSMRGVGCGLTALYGLLLLQ